MKLKPLYPTSLLAMFLLGAVLMGCSQGIRSPLSEPPGTHPDAFIETITPDIEALYLSWHELDQIHKDINYLKRGFIFDPDDRQLGYIQKVSLYLQDASVRIHNRWQQLSVLDYIHPAMLRDYLTMTAKGLATTLEAMAYDEKFIEIYAAFIEKDAVIADLDRARNQMDHIKGVLHRIRQQLVPIANNTRPSTAT